MEALPGDVMAGAGGAAGPAQDVRHQPPGKTVYIYYNCASIIINAARTVVKAFGSFMQGPWFKSPHRQFFAFLEHVQSNMILYI